MNTKKLKQLVLDLAIHGKLVPQDPNDEPASELLKRIKENVETHGRACKSKKTAISSEEIDEVPFDVPTGWVWTLLPDLCSIPITDGTHQTPTYSDKDNGVPFLSSKDVTSRRINWTNIKYITKELHTELYKRIAPQKDDILLAKNGTTGVAAIVEDDRVFDIYVTLAVIRPISELVFPLYLLYVVNSDLCKEQFNSHLTGIGLPNLHLTDIKKTIVPLPPLAEQHRIVAAIEKWFAVIDQLESNEGDLRKSIEQTKKKVLDLAIHGKLVKQDESDEPASELLKRIREEKTKTAKGKKAVSQDIDLDEVPFEVPKGWVWTNVENAFIINPKNDCDDKMMAGFVPMANVCDGFSNSFSYESKEWGLIKKGFVHFKNGDVAVAKISPCMENRKSVVFQNLPNGIGAGTTELNIFRSEIDPKYSLFFFKTDYFINKCKSTFAGTVGQQRVDKEVLLSIPFPLPPLSEQKRIVAKVEEVFGELERIGEMMR